MAAAWSTYRAHRAIVLVWPDWLVWLMAFFGFDCSWSRPFARFPLL